MKTSLVSSAVDIASAALPESANVKAARVKADQPQQLKSVTVYWRGRKMVLMQRPQRRLPALLCRLLRRSWQNLFGTLVRAIGAGALATAALSAHADTPANTLPTGYTLRDGTARMWQHRNHMTIKQSSENAMYDWQSFSIGSRAGVRFVMNDANAMALNRVLGNDPSVIMGSLTSNGKIFLINAAGILVGKTGKIDVAGFTASTLNISDADFKAGKMNFAADPGKTIGDVQNIGMIKTKSGGSVYLIGANVENDGIITAPNGQVLLAAGSMVKLVDTSLPGVSIEVSGVDGKVTNLGQIIASAGTIGIGAALIDNSGIINASSVEREGGRIFLRASTHLTTGDGSEIEANGTTGGNIQLYSDGITNIRGNVSALGSAGDGGYVDTSGMAGLSVHYVPKIGAGGEWVIDPFDIDIVHDDNNDLFIPILNDAIALVTGHTQINDGTINAQLNLGVDVTLATGPGPGPNGGRITLDSGAAISKTGGGAATLTLNATTDIYLNGTISDGSTAANANGLSLALNAGSNVNAAGNITLGGNLTSHATAFTVSSDATVNLNGSSNSFDNDFRMTGGTLNANGATVFQNASVGDNSILNLNAATTVNNNMVVSNGTLNVNAATTMVNLTMNVSSISNVNLNANLTTSQLNLMNGVIKANTASTFKVTNSFMQTNGSLDLKTAVITQATGDLQIGSGGVKVDDLTLNATNGAITQTGNVSATSLNVTASNAITLGSNDNSITNFSATNTNGDIVLNTGGAVTLTGVTANNGDITITDTNNNINIIGAISTSGATHKVKLAAGADPLARGGILQQATGAGITTQELTATAGIDVDLGDNISNNENHIATFNGKSDIGHVYLGNTGNLTTFGNIGAANEVKLYTEGSLTVGGTGITAPLINLYTASPNPVVPVNTDIAINGLLTGVVVNDLRTAATAVNLRSDTGRITQSAGIVTASLNAMAATGIALNNSNNAIGTLLAGNSISGNISVTNGSDQLLTLGAIHNSNGTIAIDTQGDMTVSDTVSSSAGTIDLTSQGNLTVDSTISSTNGVVSLSSVDGLTIGGTGSVSGHDINLNTTSAVDGDINIWGSLQATGEQRNEGPAGNITMNSSKGVFELVDNDNYYYGSIIGRTLNVTAVGDIGLKVDDVVYNNVSIFTASSTNGSIELTNFGDLTLAGITANNGAVNIDTTGSMTVNSPGIISGSGISLRTIAQEQEGQPEAFFSEGGNGGDGPPQAHADMTINGDLTADSDIGLHSAGAITQTGGKISSTNGNVSLKAHGDLTVGGDGITGQYLSLITRPANGKGDDDEPITSNIHIDGQLTANGANGVKLHSAGLITQNTSASVHAGITTALLHATAHSGIVLNSSENKVASFTARNTNRDESLLASGNIELTTGSVPLTLSGVIRNDARNADDTVSGADAANGNVTIINDGDIFVNAQQDQENGSVSAGTTALYGTVTFNSTSSNVTLGRIAAANLVVDAKNGFIDQGQSRENPSQLASNLNITGTMTASAKTGITLVALNSCGSNHIANFGATNTGSGDITLANNDNTRLGAITNTGHDISISTSDGFIQTTGDISGANIALAANSENSDHASNIIINSTLNGTGSVTLNGGETGSITEGAGGGITTAMLSATATRGITLDSANNMANGFAATNVDSAAAQADGDIKFVNNSNVTALRTLITHVVHTEHGNISIENTGAMVTTDLIDAPAGTVTLRTHSPLTIGAGGVSASGDVSLTAGNPGANSSTSDNLVINGAVASGGTVGMAAGNHLTVSAPVTAGGAVNVSTGGGVTINNPLPPGTNFFVTQTPVDPTPIDTTPIVVISPPVVPSSATNTVDQNVASTSNNANHDSNTDVVLPITTTNMPQQTANSSTNQTVGGADGEFGGSDTSKDDKKDTSGKPGKPLPICT